MKTSNTKLLLSSLIISGSLAGGVANATDQRMWREQVAQPTESVIVLESIAVDAEKKTGNDSLLWREQVDVSGTKRIFIPEPAAQHSANTSDTRLWREQIASPAVKIKERIASSSKGTDTTTN